MSQIQGCDFDLVINDKVRETKLLAREIASHGVRVLGTHIQWPRDEIFFHLDGTYSYYFKDLDPYTGSMEHLIAYSHEAFHGGLFLKGLDFIVASSALPLHKRHATLEKLGIKEAIYCDMKPPLAAFSDIMVGRSNFYQDPLQHIDRLFNLGNTKRRIFTYDHPLLMEYAQRMSEKIDYTVVPLPISEAVFAAIGFQELGDHVAVDCRARATIEILVELGYTPIPSPKPMKKTNKNRGSIRCRCTEIPRFPLKFYPFKGTQDDMSQYSRLHDLEGYRVKMDFHRLCL